HLRCSIDGLCNLLLAARWMDRLRGGYRFPRVPAFRRRLDGARGSSQTPGPEPTVQHVVGTLCIPSDYGIFCDISEDAHSAPQSDEHSRRRSRRVYEYHSKMADPNSRFAAA